MHTAHMTRLKRQIVEAKLMLSEIRLVRILCNTVRPSRACLQATRMPGNGPVMELVARDQLCSHLQILV